jgi:drug/metabolite transporter (DMT)-like permease
VVDVPPVFMVAVRGMLAGGVLYWWVRRHGAAPVAGRELLAMVPTAALLFGGGYVGVAWAEQVVASGPAALLNATTPAWVVLFEWFAGRRSRPKPGFAFALVLGVAGVGLLVGGGGGVVPVLPAIALVLASVAWAYGTLLTRMHAHGNPLRNAAVQLITGGLLLLPFSIAAGETTKIMSGFGNAALLALLYLIVVGSILGYSAYVYLLHKVDASKVASHSYVNPLIAVVVGAVIANEVITGAMVIAALLILASVFFIVRERAHAAPRREMLPPSPRPRIAA